MFANETTHQTNNNRPGRRKICPEAIMKGEMLKKKKNISGIKKKDVLIAFKNVARIIGLTELDILVVESLCRCVPPGAFEKGDEIIAVVSNETLARWRNRDKRTIQRSLSRLVNECVIIPAVGNDQKRRSAGDERLGFDLCPLVWRVEEFRSLHEQDEAEAREKKAMRRQVGRLRNTCLQITDTLPEAEQYVSEIKRLAALARNSDRLDCIMDAMIGLGALKDALLEQLVIDNGASEIIHRMTKCASDGDKNDTHQKETPLENVSKETTKKAPVYNVNEAPVYSEPGSYNSPERENQTTCTSEAGLAPNNGGGQITPRKLVALVPELDVFCKEPANPSWNEIDQAAEHLVTHLELNHRSWQRACSTIGRPAAVLILLAVMAKANSGNVRNPAGFFVRMAQMVSNGTATIQSMFYGLNTDNVESERTYH